MPYFNAEHSVWILKAFPVPAFPLTKTLCPHITRSTTLLCSSFKVCPVMFYTENVKKITWSLLFSLLNSSTYEEICTLRQSLRQSCPHDVKSERFFTFSEIFVHSRLLSIVYDSPRKLCEWEIPNTFRKSCHATWGTHVDIATLSFLAEILVK